MPLWFIKVRKFMTIIYSFVLFFVRKRSPEHCYKWFWNMNQIFDWAMIQFPVDEYPPVWVVYTVYPKKYAHGFCFAVLCCGYTLTAFPISIRLTSLALWQSNDCPSTSKATLMNMDKYFMWIHYERLHNHNKAKHNKTVCIFLGIYCISLIFCRAQITSGNY